MKITISLPKWFYLSIIVHLVRVVRRVDSVLICQRVELISI
jgi:hypothetical protein